MKLTIAFIAIFSLIVHSCHAEDTSMVAEESLEELMVHDTPSSGGGEDDNSVLCHRVSRFVNFHEELGFSSIIVPIGFDIGICEGYCPEIGTENINTHMQIWRLLRPNDAYSPCCVPTKFKNVEVIVKNNDNFSIQIIPDMVVESCGCH